MCTLLIPSCCVISQESPRPLLATNTQGAGDEWAQASRLLQSCSRALCDTSVTNAARKGKVETLKKSAALLFPSTCVTMRDTARQCALLLIYLASSSVSLLFHSSAFQNAESKVELLAKNKCMQSTLLDIMLE
jgi:hypothetical protein